MITGESLPFPGPQTLLCKTGITLFDGVLLRIMPDTQTIMKMTLLALTVFEKLQQHLN